MMMKSDLHHHEIQFAPTRIGMSSPINAVAGFVHYPDFVLGFLQDVAGASLTPQELALAKNIGLRVASGHETTLRELVEAWEGAPELLEFSLAVARSMLPER